MADFSEAPRIPPQNLEAEQAVLGAVLSDNSNLDRLEEFLKPAHFIHPVHAKIYEICLKNRPMDIVKLKPFFVNDDSLKDVGGVAYLAKLASSAATIINAVEYGREILDCYTRRQLISLGTDVVNKAFEHNLDEDASQQIENAEKSLFELANERELEGGPQALSEGLKSTLELTEKAIKNPAGIGGVPTGLTKLDALLGGFNNTDLIILGGRPGMGKSALAITLAFNIAQYFEQENKKPGTAHKSVAFFSLEMSAEQVAGRILSSKTSISSHDMRLGKLSDDQFDELAAGVKLLTKIPLYIDETSGITVTAIKNRARRMARNKEQGLGLIVIDYLQLISSSGRKENRVQELSEMTRALKIMAKELGVPVLVLSQLSRRIESAEGEGNRPKLSDLRDSGSIEQDADIVMFVYRDYYYLKNKEIQRTATETDEKFALRKANLEQRKQETENLAEVIVEKHRHGPTGKIDLYFNGRFGQFTDLDKVDVIPK